MIDKALFTQNEFQTGVIRELELESNKLEDHYQTAMKNGQNKNITLLAGIFFSWLNQEITTLKTALKGNSTFDMQKPVYLISEMTRFRELIKNKGCYCIQDPNWCDLS